MAASGERCAPSPAGSACSPVAEGARASRGKSMRGSIPLAPVGELQSDSLPSSPPKRLTLSPVAPRRSTAMDQHHGLGERISPLEVLIDEMTGGEPEFAEDNALLKELRSIWRWMAQEPGCTAIPSRTFKQRLPELHQRMPQIAFAFGRMDVNGDCWLTWEEFVAFCLKDLRLQRQMKKSSTVTVYARERCSSKSAGSAVYKDAFDPRRTCDVGTPPHVLPWEAHHVVEWRIEGLASGKGRGSPLTYMGCPVRAGTSLASPPFRAAGVCGFLRLWPAGYWTETQRRTKTPLPHASADPLVMGPYPVPSAEAWCCVGACMPSGTHLVFRFFIGDEKSPKRECYWHDGTHPGQLWSPADKEPPSLQPGDSLKVGVEIIRNCGHVSKPQRRCAEMRRPALGEIDMVGNHRGRTDERSMRLPKRSTTCSWRKLDTLLQDHRRAQLQQHDGQVSPGTALPRSASGPVGVA